MDFLEKLDYLISSNNLNKHSLSEQSGIPYTTIVGLYKKGYENIKLPTIQKLACFFDTTIDYLMRDEITDINYGKNNTDNIPKDIMMVANKYNRLDKHGKKVVDDLIDSELERIEEEQRIRDEKSKHKTLSSNELTTQDVLTFDLPASAGTGMFLDSESCEHIEYPADIVPTGTDFAIRISGNSMEPKYIDGSVAFVRKVEVSDGDIGIFVLNGDGYIKKLEYRDSSTYLVSLNPKYDDIKILESDSLYCVGKVLN